MKCSVCGSEELTFEGIDPSRLFNAYICENCSARNFYPRELSHWKEHAERYAADVSRVVAPTPVQQPVRESPFSSPFTMARSEVQAPTFEVRERMSTPQPATNMMHTAPSEGTQQKRAISLFDETRFSPQSMGGIGMDNSQSVGMSPTAVPEEPISSPKLPQRIHIPKSVVEQIQREAKAALESGDPHANQTFGILLGESNGEEIVVRSALQLRDVEELSLGLVEEDIDVIVEAQTDENYLVGWYHSHAIGGLRPTPTCTTLHQRSFLEGAEDAVGVICDPHNENELLAFTVNEQGEHVFLSLEIIEG